MGPGRSIVCKEFIACLWSTPKKCTAQAYDGGFAVGAFNVNNMEITQGIIEACAAEKRPLILQISKGARKYANMRYLQDIIDAAVEEHPELPIAIHCDHGDTLRPGADSASTDGFTSVMIDGSHHPYEKNIKLTAEVGEVRPRQRRDRRGRAGHARRHRGRRRRPGRGVREELENS